MDTQSTDILKQLLERLDKMDIQQHKLDRQQHTMDSQQYKLDRVMERLDTLQNIIERQNQKQNLLDEKLVEMTIKREQEKDVTSEHLEEALQQIAEPLHVINSQEGTTSSPHKIPQPLQSSDTQIDDKLKSIEDRTVDTAQQCHQLILWSRKMEEKMIELAGKSVEMKTFLVEMRSVKDLIKGQTNSELVWLNNQIDQKLTDIGSVVRAIYQQHAEAKEETVLPTGQGLKTDMKYGNQQLDTNEPKSDKQLSKEVCDKQMQVILDLDRKLEQLNSLVVDVSRDVKASLDNIFVTNKQSIIDLENTMTEINNFNKEQSLLRNRTLQSDLNKHFEVVQSELQTNRKTVITESQTQTSRIISAAEIAKEDLKLLIQTERDNTSKCKVETGGVDSSINFLLESMQANVATIIKKVDSTEALMISKHQTENNKLEELTTDLKDYIYETKREIFAVTEKEAQIVRDRIQGPLPSQGKYTFDFYVNNFKTLVRSGERIHSLPWHINELQTCVIGWVTMSTNGKMDVWFGYGRPAREVGLQPRSGNTIRVKATIIDICDKKLETLNVGVRNFDFDETDHVCNSEWGMQIGLRSCDMLLKRGYGDKEGYCNEALLIRYEVTVK